MTIQIPVLYFVLSILLFAHLSFGLGYFTRCVTIDNARIYTKEYREEMKLTRNIFSKTLLIFEFFCLIPSILILVGFACPLVDYLIDKTGKGRDNWILSRAKEIKQQRAQERKKR